MEVNGIPRLPDKVEHLRSVGRPDGPARTDGAAGRCIESCIEDHEQELKTMNTDAKKNRFRPGLEAVEGRCLTAANALAGVHAAHVPAEVAAYRSHDHGAHDHALARPRHAAAAVDRDLAHSRRGVTAEFLARRYGVPVVVAADPSHGLENQGQGSIRAAGHYGPGFNPSLHTSQLTSDGNTFYAYVSHHTHSNVYP